MSKGDAHLTASSSSRKAFAERLTSALSERGMKRQASQATGASESAIIKWCKGQTEPSRDFLVSMAEFLNVSVEWLATGKSPNTHDGLLSHPISGYNPEIVHTIALWMAEKSDLVDADPEEFANYFKQLCDHFHEKPDEPQVIENVIEFHAATRKRHS